MNSAVQIAPARVTIHNTDLLEAGIVALEGDQYNQCTGQLRMMPAAHWPDSDQKPMHCAEGVFAEILVMVYPFRFGWSNDGQLLDRDRMDAGGTYRVSTLLYDHWDLLHPRGAVIAHRVATRLGSGSVSGANDNGKATFKEFAAAFRKTRAEVEAMHPAEAAYIRENLSSLFATIESQHPF